MRETDELLPASQHKIVRFITEWRLDAQPNRIRIAGGVQGEVADQGVFYAEDRIGIEEFIGIVVDVLRQAQHDLAQARIGSAFEAPENFRGDVVFGGEWVFTTGDVAMVFL